MLQKHTLVSSKNLPCENCREKWYYRRKYEPHKTGPSSEYVFPRAVSEGRILKKVTPIKSMNFEECKFCSRLHTEIQLNGYVIYTLSEIKYEYMDLVFYLHMCFKIQDNRKEQRGKEQQIITYTR